jgi:hypothetical protein
LVHVSCMAASVSPTSPIDACPVAALHRYSVFQDTTDAVQQVADPAVMGLWPVSQVKAGRLDDTWTVVDVDTTWRGRSLYDLLYTNLVPWRPTGFQTDSFKVCHDAEDGDRGISTRSMGT